MAGFAPWGICVVKGVVARPSMPSLVISAVQIVYREGRRRHLNVKG